MKPIRLTEQELRNIIQESVKTILNECGYRTAALAHGANYNATQSDIRQKAPNAKSKMDSANIKRVPDLNQAIEDTIGIVSLTFIETDKKSNQSYSVVLNEGRIKYI